MKKSMRGYGFYMLILVIVLLAISVSDGMGKNGSRESMLLLLSRFSRVRLCATPWTAAHQAPPFMGFSRQEYWNGVPLPSPRESIVEVKDTGVEAWTRAVVAAEMDANRSRRQV